MASMTCCYLQQCSCPRQIASDLSDGVARACSSLPKSETLSWGLTLIDSPHH